MKKAANIVVRLLMDGQVKSAWEEKAHDFEAILEKMVKTQEKVEKSQFLSSTTQSTYTLLKRGDANGKIGKILSSVVFVW